MEKINWIKKRIESAMTHLPKTYQVTKKICQNKAENTLTDENGEAFDDFTTLSYLSLHQKIKPKYYHYDMQYGHSLSVARTRMKRTLEEDIEKRLTNLFCGYHPTIFGSTHMAMLGLLPLAASGSIPSFAQNKKIVMLFDHIVHQSTKILRDIVTRIAEFSFVNCMEVKNVEQALQHYSNNGYQAIIVTDSLGSMGNVYPVIALTELAREYQSFIIFDDAQSCSIHGHRGCGYVLEQLNYQKCDHVAFVTSFHKGFGASGSAIFMPQKSQKDFLETYATTYCFSGPISIPELARIEACLSYHEDTRLIQNLQDTLWDNIAYFDRFLPKSFGNLYRYQPLPYRVILCGHETQALDLWKMLKNNGILTLCAVYPTVPKEQAIIRISFHASHDKKAIKKLADMIYQTKIVTAENVGIKDIIDHDNQRKSETQL
ncbi:PLP-dependent aminotransferase family protein [Facilibium subflavum]|uniref:hypothetical protein n=1 Tax=Facilibium subflavum TaxID=2219058 RepID=UPI000E65BAEB|nr:hypothetical protein [Facilibium subflavum]